MYIAVAGNIGSGKTTLTRMLARHYGWTAKYESVVENPYLDDYYRDIPRWAFNMEVYYLAQRFRDMLDIARSTVDIIQDRTIYEGVHVFAANNYDMGNLSEKDYRTYLDLFDDMAAVMRQPDLMVYLRCSVPVLVAHIQQRGRDCERTISLDYLRGLNERYETFVKSMYRGRVLVVQADGMDFEHSRHDFARIVGKIDAELYGLFPNLTIKNQCT